MTLRLTVVRGARRRDLVMPAEVAVVELVPELAGVLGVDDSGAAYAGFRLLRCDGRVLDPTVSLGAQHVAEGEILTLADLPPEPSPDVYDDEAEAMAAIVSGVVRWDSAAGRRACIGAAAALLAAGAWALVLCRESHAATAAAAWTSAALVGSALWAARAGRADVAIVSAWAGCAYAGVTAWLAAPGGPFDGRSVGASGAAALLAALAAGCGTRAARVRLLPPAVGGAALLATGLVAERWGWDQAEFLTAVLVVVVLAHSLSPSVAIRIVTGSPAAVEADERPVDEARVHAQALAAHELLVWATASVAVVFALVAAPAVSLGLSGTAIELLGCLVVGLRTRHLQGLRPVLAGIGAGLTGLLATVASVVCLHPAWRHATVLGLAGGGLALLGCATVSGGGVLARSRLADLVEGLAHVALVPTLVVATGALSVIPR